MIPPFILLETEIILDNMSKIHAEDPGIEDHLIYFNETGFRIPLLLWGTFSYFPTSKPFEVFLNSCDKIYLMTPTNFNPHCTIYGCNKEAMIDWQGNIVD